MVLCVQFTYPSRFQSSGANHCDLNSLLDLRKVINFFWCVCVGGTSLNCEDRSGNFQALFMSELKPEVIAEGRLI